MSNTDRQSLLGSWAIWAGTNPKKVFLLVFLITAVMITGTLHMKMEMTFYSIMPQKSHHVQDMKRITENYPFASTIIAVIDGRGLPETEAKASVKAAIDEMEMSFLSEEFSDAVSGVYSRVDLDFLKEHGFLLTEEKDLKRMARMYADPELLPFLTALNDDLEREYSGDGEAMDDDETRLSAWLGGLEDLLSLLADSLEGELPKGEMESAMDSYLLGESYYLSREENMGIIFINPTYTVNDLGPLVKQTNRIDLKVTEIARSRGLDAGITGFIVVGRDEMVTSEQGFALSMILALVLILLLMIAVFRMRSTPLIIGTPPFPGDTLDFRDDGVSPAPAQYHDRHVYGGPPGAWGGLCHPPDDRLCTGAGPGAGFPPGTEGGICKGWQGGYYRRPYNGGGLLCSADG